VPVTGTLSTRRLAVLPLMIPRLPPQTQPFPIRYQMWFHQSW
jgi:hypothetical protein